jgi:hypothetical protein
MTLEVFFMSSARRRSAWAGSVAGPIAAALLVATPALAAVTPDDQTQLVRVTQNGADPSTQWVEQAYDENDTDPNAPFLTPDQDFVQGPTANPALGAGSHVMHIGQYTGQVELYRTAQYDGTKASDIHHISYATYAESTNNCDCVKQPAAFRLSFNTAGDANGAPDAFLYYEPSINHPAAVQDGVWQNWDTTNEQWSTDGGPTNLTTLQQFATNNPNAVIAGHTSGSAGGVAMFAEANGGQRNGNYGVDRVGFTTATSSTLFDFDPSVNKAVDNVTVTDGAPNGWNAGAFDFGATPNPVPAAVDQSMAFGPGTPPAGIGSHLMREGDNENIVQFWRTGELDGVNVGDIRTLDYSTYVKPDAGNAHADSQQPAYLRLSISSDGSGTKDTTLNFEPANNPDLGAVQQNAWQTWHTASGLYRVVEGPGETADSLITLASYAERHPNATIVPRAVSGQGTGGLAFLVGAGGDNQVDSNFYVDNVETDFFHGAAPDTDRTFDFEPTVPAPSINVPSVVTGRSNIAITGNTHTDSAAPVALFEKAFGQSGFTQVAQTTSASDGSYSFNRTVTKQSSFFVRSYDRTDSATKTVKVRIAVGLTLTSPKTGKLSMSVHTSPRAVGETVKFYRLNRDGTHTLLATRTTGSRGGAHATINYRSGHRVTVYATVTPPPGNLKGRSANESIRVS